MKYPLVSILVAAKNAERTIVACIESLLEQTYPNIEILICDDNSDDKTFDIINSYQEKDSRIRTFHNNSDMYQAYSRNVCLNSCNGFYVAIQDADDISDKDRILKQVIELEENPKISFISCGWYKFDDNGIYEHCVPKHRYPIKTDFFQGIPFCHAATLFRRSCIEAVHGYRVSKTTIRAEDYDMIMRIYTAGFLGMNIYDCLYGYRVDSNTLGRRTLKFRIDECKIRYEGFKKMKILHLGGILFVLKPIASYYVQKVKQWRI